MRWLAAVLMLVVVAMTVFTYRMWFPPLDDPEQRTKLDWTPPAIAETAIISPDPREDMFPETLARPLFSPSRRVFMAPVLEPPPEDIPAPDLAPPEPVIVDLPPPVQQADASGLELKGVMLGDAIARALILSPSLPAARWLTIGSEVQGFRLVSIADDRVVLESGPQSIELKLYVDNRAN